MAKLPSQNPLATRLRKAAKAAMDAESRKNAAASAALQRGAVERGNREQAREDREYEMVFKKKPMAKGGKVMKHASKAGNAMKKKSADTMGRAMVKKYAKGGSVGKADGCATKGKTKTKMVKMAMGGMVGTGKMPASGGKAGMAPAGRAAMMSRQGNNRGAAMLPGRRTFKGGGSCGMKKGK